MNKCTKSKQITTKKYKEKVNLKVYCTLNFTSKFLSNRFTQASFMVAAFTRLKHLGRSVHLTYPRIPPCSLIYHDNIKAIESEGHPAGHFAVILHQSQPALYTFLALWVNRKPQANAY